MSNDTLSNTYSILVDTHCHTYASFHAMCTILEVLALAKKRGLHGVSITDHHPTLQSDEKRASVRAADRAYWGVFCQRLQNIDDEIEMFKGVELNLLDHEPWLTSEAAGFFKNLDFRLAGIHMLDHLFQDSSNAIKNTDAILSAIYSGKERSFEIMAHPVVTQAPLDHLTVIQAAKKRGIALELNNSVLLYNKCDRDELRSFMEAVASEGVYIAVGSDAHTPNEVGLFDQAVALLQEIHFPESLIINRTLESFTKFLTTKTAQ